MNPRDIYITKFDFVRLKELLQAGIRLMNEITTTWRVCSMSWTGRTSWTPQQFLITWLP